MPTGFMTGQTWVFSRGYGFVRDLRVITGGFDAKVGFLQTNVDPMKLCMRELLEATNPKKERCCRLAHFFSKNAPRFCHLGDPGVPTRCGWLGVGWPHPHSL